MSDGDKPSGEPGMGVVKRRRSRKLLETRETVAEPERTKSGPAAAAAPAATAWGEHLEAQVRDGVDRTPDPVPTGTVDATPGVIDSKPSDSERSRRRLPKDDEPSRVKARPPRPPNRRKRALPDILRDDVVATPKPKPDVSDVVDLLAHQQESYEDQTRFDGLSAFSLRRNRLWLSLTALVAATVLAALPVYSEWSRRTAGVQLQAVLTHQASAIAGAHPNLAALVQGSEFAALRRIYADQHARLVEAVRAAGFDEVQDQNVTIRVDFRAAALVLGVGMERTGGETIAAQASTTGQPIGRALPEASIGAAVQEHALDVATLGLLFLVVVLGLYLGPSLVEVLEARRASADLRRRAAAERVEFEQLTRDG